MKCAIICFLAGASLALLVPGSSCAGATDAAAASRPSSESAGSATSPDVRVYAVNRRVRDFPDNADLSTPENAYATCNRIGIKGDMALWVNVSAARLADILRNSKESASPLPEWRAKAFLDSNILEVQVSKGDYAAVFAEERKNPGEDATVICKRSFELENGQWRNVGCGRFDTIEKAREHFARLCEKRIPREPLSPVSKTDDYLRPFLDHLAVAGQDPETFLLDAVENHKLTIAGEMHHRPAYWALNVRVVKDPRFRRACGVIYMELPVHAQPLVDAFLANDTLDTQPVIDTLRDMMWTGWPDQGMLDFFVAVWQANQDASPDERVRIVLVDMPRPWARIAKREDWDQYNVDRNDFMAQNVLRDMTETADKRNALSIVGFGHAVENLKLSVGDTPLRTAGWHLSQALGDDVFSIMPHTPKSTNMGEIHGRLQLGLFDSAFAANGNRPVAFTLEGSPFGERDFDALPDHPHKGRYRDAFDGYVFLKPLEDERFAPLIEGFYTVDFRTSCRPREGTDEEFVELIHLWVMGHSLKKSFAPEGGPQRGEGVLEGRRAFGGVPRRRRQGG